jgi:serine protease Do
MITSNILNKFIALLIVMILSTSLSINADNIKIGTDIGDALETNISALISNKAIPVMVINNNIAVEARLLSNYGFDVIADANKKEVKISYNYSKKLNPPGMQAGKAVTPGKKIADVLKTDIKVMLNDKIIQSYSVKGYTVVLLKDFKDLGELNWNSNNRTSSLTIKPKDNSNTQLSVQEIVKQNDIKICLIETTDGGGNKFQGSGILIKESLFLTNYHVVKDAHSAKIKLINNKTYDIQGIVVFDEDRDLAVVKIAEKTNIAPVTLGKLKEIEKGQHAIAIGSPEGLQNTVSEGIVSNIISKNGLDIIQISVPVTYGSSGGALFNDKGQVIGVTTAVVYDGSLDLNFAVPIDYIDNWMTTTLSKDVSTLTASFPAKLVPNPKIAIPQPVAAKSSIKEKVSIEALQAMLEAKYGKISTSKGNFDIYDWYVEEEGSTFMIYASIDPLQYFKYLTNYRTISDELMSWSEELAYTLDEYCPNNNVSLGVFYNDYYSKMPSSFEAREVSYSADTNKYLVSHMIITIIVDDDLEWTVRP